MVTFVAQSLAQTSCVHTLSSVTFHCLFLVWVSLGARQRWTDGGCSKGWVRSGELWSPK